VPGYEVQVVDERGAPVATGEVGQLRVRGGSIAAGYWQRAEATRRAFRGEWLVTGDQAIEQTDGTFCLLGRTDDMLKVSGQWVSPPEVEGVIAAVAGVRECAVIGCAGESGLMELVACVVSLPGEEEAVGLRIERACAEGLPRFKRPKRVAFLASLPRTPTGKVQRFVLRDLARMGTRVRSIGS
jgi:acyl-coenzyme A synthetase/AMP-(fatty) acid ligase